MNTDRFLIEETEIKEAQMICNAIKNPDIRNRAVASALVANIAKKYFADMDVDVDSALHKFEVILSDINISDIYIRNSYIDTRLYFEGDTLCIPKEHFERNILPVAYMFIKLNSDLSEALVTGFVLPENVDKTKEADGYYIFNEDDLSSFYDVEPLLVELNADEIPDDINIQIIEFLDGKLEDRDDFYRTLLSSRYCRELFTKALSTEILLSNISSEDNREEIVENNIEELSPVALDLEESSEGEKLLLVEADDISIDGISNENELTLPEPDELDVKDELFSEDLLLEETNDFHINSVSDDDLIMEEQEELITEYETVDDVDNEEVEDVSDSVIDLEEASGQADDINNEEAEIVNDEEVLLELEDEITEIEVEEPENQAISEEISSQEILQEMLDDEDKADYLGEIEEIEESEEKVTVVAQENEIEENDTSQIEQLFEDSTESNNTIEENFIPEVSKKSNKMGPLLFVIIVGLGVFGYFKMGNTITSLIEGDKPKVAKQLPKSEPVVKEEVAMPNETVENVPSIEETEEGNAVSIPTIEKNLDASVLISNLSVNWEVPASYLSNSSAKRYFTKLGKIIQLNLKTELLLLSRPPITNKITLELEFDSVNSKFIVKDITASSGEKLVDDTIMKTVKQALDINLKTNISSFANASSNPTLVIRL